MLCLIVLSCGQNNVQNESTIHTNGHIQLKFASIDSIFYRANPDVLRIRPIASGNLKVVDSLYNSSDDEVRAIYFSNYKFKLDLISESGDTFFYDSKSVHFKEQILVEVPADQRFICQFHFSVEKPRKFLLWRILDQDVMTLLVDDHLISAYRESHVPFFRILGMGALMFFALYHFFVYLTGKRRIYLFHALFILSHIAFFVKYGPWYNLELIYENFDYRLFSVGFNSVQACMYVFYSVFVMYLFQTKTKHKKIHRALQFFFGVSLIYVFINIFLALGGNYKLVYVMFTIYRLFAVIMGIILNTYFLLYWNRVSAYFILGGFVVLISGVLAWLSSEYIIPRYGGFGGIDYMFVGSLIEILAFSLALGIKHKLDEKEKQVAQDRLINQLETNDRLQQELQNKLEVELQQAIKISELSSLEKLMIGSELKSLRTQMNPHFLFNSINSLKHCIIENETKVATQYLDIFAMMFRKILVNSREKMVSIQEEIDLLKLYVQAEAIRFKNDIEFIINVDEGLDNHFSKMPPMFLQPIVENSIWHGFLPKQDGNNILKLDFKRIIKGSNEMLEVSITDNGVGRIHRETKSKNHKSLATTIIHERLELLNKIEHVNSSIRIQDLYDDRHLPSGTKTILTVPLAS